VFARFSSRSPYIYCVVVKILCSAGYCSRIYNGVDSTGCTVTTQTDYIIHYIHITATIQIQSVDRSCCSWGNSVNKVTTYQTISFVVNGHCVGSRSFNHFTYCITCNINITIVHRCIYSYPVFACQRIPVETLDYISTYYRFFSNIGIRTNINTG